MKPASTSAKTLQKERLRPQGNRQPLNTRAENSPSTNFKGFSHLFGVILTLEYDIRFLLAAPFLYALRPVLSAPCALLHAPFATRSLWRTKGPIPSLAGSRAQLCALVLRLSLGEFFFFFLLTPDL